jgi:Clp amino terminal domain, pathogenicity island component
MTTESVAPEALHAWAIYLQASEEARRRGDRRTGTDHILLALFEDPSIEVVLGVSLQQARQALESLDHEALGALGLESGTDAPPLPMRAVPKKPRLRDVARKDRLRMTPAAKKVLEQAYKPKGHRKLQVTGPEVLAQILALQPPDPAAVLLGALGVNTSDALHALAPALAQPDQTEGRR